MQNTYKGTYKHFETVSIRTCQLDPFISKKQIADAQRGHDTGGRRPVGCLKWLVIFRRRATNHRARLPIKIKHPMTLRHSVQSKSCSAKKQLIIGLFCGTWHIKTRHPMTLCHFVQSRSCSAKEPLIIGLFCGT